MATLITGKTVDAIAGTNHGSRYRKMREETFPLPVKTGKRSVRWVLEEVQAWVDEQVRDRPRAKYKKRP